MAFVSFSDFEVKLTWTEPKIQRTKSHVRLVVQGKNRHSRAHKKNTEVTVKCLFLLPEVLVAILRSSSLGQGKENRKRKKERNFVHST